MSTIVPPSSRSCRSTFHSSCTSGGESTAVGSSRIRMRRAAVEHLQDLDALRLADREIARRAVPRATRQSRALDASSRHLLLGGGAIEPTGRAAARGRAPRSRRR